jgi:hypothetical protein
MNEWVWSNGGMILTGEKWSTGRGTLYSVCGRWMNENEAFVEWYWQGKSELLGEEHYTACVVDEWMSMEEWLNDTDRGNPRKLVTNLSQCVFQQKSHVLVTEPEVPKWRNEPLTVWFTATHVLFDITPFSLVINPRLSYVRPDRKLYEGHTVSPRQWLIHEYSVSLFTLLNTWDLSFCRGLCYSQVSWLWYGLPHICVKLVWLRSVRQIGSFSLTSEINNVVSAGIWFITYFRLDVNLVKAQNFLCYANLIVGNTATLY